MTLPTDRSLASTDPEHVDDHNTLHEKHNDVIAVVTVDGVVVPNSGLASAADLKELIVQSTNDGGESTFDSTGRLNLESYQQAISPNHFGEVIRMKMKTEDSKQMLAWVEDFGEVGHPRTAVWLGAHWKLPASLGGATHAHFSIEIPDSNGDLQTRLEIPYGDADTDTFGIDRTPITTHMADFIIREGRLRLSNNYDGGKLIDFSSHEDGGAAVRFRIGVEETANDFVIRAYSPDGNTLSAEIKIDRATGALTTPADIEVTDTDAGVILRSPNGTRYRLTVDDSGNLGTEAV